MPTEPCLPLGMENGKILDSAIRASSTYHEMHRPQLARLHRTEFEHFSWAPADPYDSWIQVDLGEVKSVTGVATQGRPSHPQWTTSYKLSFSDNSQNWEVYKESGSEKVCVILIVC